MSRELLARALDALGTSTWDHTRAVGKQELIAALRAALAQPEPTPAVPSEAALNTLARLFHNGEEIEGDDGAAMMVDLSLWHEASEAFDSLIGDGDGETLASSAAPAVPLTDERAAFEAWIRKDSGDLATFGSGSNMHYRNSAVNNAWTGWQARAHAAAVSADKDARIKVLEEALWAADLAFAEHGILAVHATRMQVRAALGDKND